jgi:hypothetical protein
MRARITRALDVLSLYPADRRYGSVCRVDHNASSMSGGVTQVPRIPLAKRSQRLHNGQAPWAQGSTTSGAVYITDDV